MWPRYQRNHNYSAQKHDLHEIINAVSSGETMYAMWFASAECEAKRMTIPTWCSIIFIQKDFQPARIQTLHLILRNDITFINFQQSFWIHLQWKPSIVRIHLDLHMFCWRFFNQFYGVCMKFYNYISFWIFDHGYSHSFWQLKDHLDTLLVCHRSSAQKIEQHTRERDRERKKATGTMNSTK